MADEQDTTYPVIPDKNWWALRKKFKQSLPNNLTPAILAIMLGMEERSAKNNVYIQLIKLGIIDKDGKVVAEIANKWREDEHYAGVCKKILFEVYPKELIELAPGPEINRNEVERWFRINAGVGENTAARMARSYQLLAEADVSKSVLDEINSPARPKKDRLLKPTKKLTKTTISELPKDTPVNNSTHQQKTSEDLLPSIHIDIQIHISPDSSPEQIEKIFENMAKHLYPNRNN